MLSTLKQWARVIKRDVIALWIAAGDPRVPWYAKVAAGAVAAYALSPIDLIPDSFQYLAISMTSSSCRSAFCLSFAWCLKP